MKFTLYIGNNKNDLREYGFNNVMIRNTSHYAKGNSAYNSLVSSDSLPQIIFCKIDSQINPFRLINLIKANQRLNKIVFILLTKTMSKKEIRYAFHLGIDEVIKAPHKIHRYIKRIKFLVEYKI